MTADELDMLAELEAKATKGPWKSGCVGQHEDERPVMFYRATGYEPPETITDSMRQGAINLSLVDSLRNAAPDLIAMARWAEKAKQATAVATEHCLACYGPGGRIANGLDTSIGCSHCKPLREALAAYPTTTSPARAKE